MPLWLIYVNYATRADKTKKPPWRDAQNLQSIINQRRNYMSLKKLVCMLRVAVGIRLICLPMLGISCVYAANGSQTEELNPDCDAAAYVKARGLGDDDRLFIMPGNGFNGLTGQQVKLGIDLDDLNYFAGDSKGEDGEEDKSELRRSYKMKGPDQQTVANYVSFAELVEKSKETKTDFGASGTYGLVSAAAQLGIATSDQKTSSVGKILKVVGTSKSFTVLLDVDNYDGQSHNYYDATGQMFRSVTPDRFSELLQKVKDSTTAPDKMKYSALFYREFGTDLITSVTYEATSQVFELFCRKGNGQTSESGLNMSSELSAGAVMSANFGYGEMTSKSLAANSFSYSFLGLHIPYIATMEAATQELLDKLNANVTDNNGMLDLGVKPPEQKIKEYPTLKSLADTSDAALKKHTEKDEKLSTAKGELTALLKASSAYQSYITGHPNPDEEEQIIIKDNLTTLGKELDQWRITEEEGLLQLTAAQQIQVNEAKKIYEEAKKLTDGELFTREDIERAKDQAVTEAENKEKVIEETKPLTYEQWLRAEKWDKDASARFKKKYQDNFDTFVLKMDKTLKTRYVRQYEEYLRELEENENRKTGQYTGNSFNRETPQLDLITIQKLISEPAQTDLLIEDDDVRYERERINYYKDMIRMVSVASDDDTSALQSYKVKDFRTMAWSELYPSLIPLDEIVSSNLFLTDTLNQIDEYLKMYSYAQFVVDVMQRNEVEELSLTLYSAEEKKVYADIMKIRDKLLANYTNGYGGGGRTGDIVYTLGDLDSYISVLNEIYLTKERSLLRTVGKNDFSGNQFVGVDGGGTGDWFKLYQFFEEKGLLNTSGSFLFKAYETDSKDTSEVVRMGMSVGVQGSDGQELILDTKNPITYNRLNKTVKGQDLGRIFDGSREVFNYSWIRRATSPIGYTPKTTADKELYKKICGSADRWPTATCQQLEKKVSAFPSYMILIGDKAKGSFSYETTTQSTDEEEKTLTLSFASGLGIVNNVAYAPLYGQTRTGKGVLVSTTTCLNGDPIAKGCKSTGNMVFTGDILEHRIGNESDVNNRRSYEFIYDYDYLGLRDYKEWGTLGYKCLKPGGGWMNGAPGVVCDTYYNQDATKELFESTRVLLTPVTSNVFENMSKVNDPLKDISTLKIFYSGPFGVSSAIYSILRGD